MNLDPGIVCYQHCQGRLFAFSLPTTCLFCKADLTTESLSSPPFRLPYPFVRACQAPCSLVIRPSKGDFLHEYRGSGAGGDLHIGVTDSEGHVHEYDSDGLHSDYTRSWTQALAVPIISDAANRLHPVWREYWDFTLHTLSQDSAWAMERYCETTHNCYDFVLEFLRVLSPPGLEDARRLTKRSLCARHLLPHTAAAAKYISLYRRLLEQPVVAVPAKTAKPDPSLLNP